MDAGRPTSKWCQEGNSRAGDTASSLGWPALLLAPSPVLLLEEVLQSSARPLDGVSKDQEEGAPRERGALEGDDDDQSLARVAEEEDGSSALSASVLSPLHTEYRGVFTAEPQDTGPWEATRGAPGSALDKGQVRGAGVASMRKPKTQRTHTMPPNATLGRFIFR